VKPDSSFHFSQRRNAPAFWAESRPQATACCRFPAPPSACCTIAPPDDAPLTAAHWKLMGVLAVALLPVSALIGTP
jgi:hypothetical protein